MLASVTIFFWLLFDFMEIGSKTALTFFKKRLEFVGNKAKGRISKRVFKENKARKIFRKTKISYPLIQSVPTSQNGQTHSNNSSVKADQLFVWSWRLKSSEQLLFKKRCLWPNLTSRNCLECCEKLWEILFFERSNTSVYLELRRLSSTKLILSMLEIFSKFDV